VYFAQTLPFGLQHPDYLPMYVGTYILGGNFSARLMQTVRDEQGLTYGIGSGLAGMTQEYAGHWQTNVTLSQENLEKGIEATQEQINKFVAEGITEAELEEKKTTLTGKYKVELATTAGLARTMQMNAEEGFNASWMDEYPESIQALTAQQINDVVQNHLHPDQLHIAIAGTMPGE
jgi:predicted Zn-dependent peptidase